MTIVKIVIIVIPFLLFSCTGLKKINSSKRKSKSYKQYSKREYHLTDNAGEFIVTRESGVDQKNKKHVVVKRKILSIIDRKPLEKSILVSARGVLGKKVNVLRPLRALYSVWFNGAEYRSELKLNLKKRSMDINLKSPEAKWNGTRTVEFPKGNGLYCFFGQLVECVKETGFFSKSRKMKSGKMKFHIVWDGYPYVQQQYLRLPSTLFSEAMLSFEKSNRKGEYKYSLNFARQVLFFFVDKKNVLTRKFWISQGLSMVPKS